MLSEGTCGSSADTYPSPSPVHVYDAIALVPVMIMSKETGPFQQFGVVGSKCNIRYYMVYANAARLSWLQ